MAVTYDPCPGCGEFWHEPGRLEDAVQRATAWSVARWPDVIVITLAEWNRGRNPALRAEAARRTQEGPAHAP